MRSPIAAGTLVLVLSSCARDEPTRVLYVPERIELCAAAPHATPLDHVRATQWRMAIAAGEHELPAEQVLPEGATVASAEGSPLSGLVEVYDVQGRDPLDAPPEVAVLQRADLSLRPDDARDALLVWSWVDDLLGASGPWRLTIASDADRGDDFLLDGPPSVLLGCPGDIQTSACPNRRLDACDPGGPTVRTRVTLDRGELVLDVRYVERMPLDGDLSSVMFVHGEARLDDVDVAQDDFFRLLHSTAYSAVGDGSYAIVAPEAFAAAGLGCGIAITDVGGAQPRSFTIDCDLLELESLAIVDIAREAGP